MDFSHYGILELGILDMIEDLNSRKFSIDESVKLLKKLYNERIIFHDGFYIENFFLLNIFF